MDYTPVVSLATWQAATVAVLAIFAALAGVLIVIAGCRRLLDAIGNDDDTDDDAEVDDDHDDEESRSD